MHLVQEKSCYFPGHRVVLKKRTKGKLENFGQEDTLNVWDKVTVKFLLISIWHPQSQYGLSSKMISVILEEKGGFSTNSGPNIEPIKKRKIDRF